jgi:hypothetical protein
MHDLPHAAAAIPEVEVTIETVDSSSFFLEEDTHDAAAADAIPSTAPSKAVRDSALLSGRAPLPPTADILKPRPVQPSNSALSSSTAQGGRGSPPFGYDAGSWCSVASLIAAPRSWSQSFRKPVPLAAAALGNAICVCDDGSVSIVPFESFATGTVEHIVEATKELPSPFSSRDDVVTNSAMMYASSARQLLLTTTASTMHLLSVGSDCTDIIGRHVTEGLITCLSVPSGGLGARLHQHVFVGSSSGSAGLLELIDVDASTARPILSLNRGLVTQPMAGSTGGVSAVSSLPSNPFLVAAGLTDGMPDEIAAVASQASLQKKKFQ